MDQLSTKPKNGSRIHRSEVEIQEIMSEYESVKGSMSVGEFCELYNLNESTFYSWQRKLNQRGENGSFFSMNDLLPATSQTSSGNYEGSVFVSYHLESKEIRVHQYVEPSFLRALFGLGGEQ